MSDTPEPQPEPEAQAPAGPFFVRGSDGSERGPYPTLEAAQNSKANVEGIHKADGLEFVITDPNGAVVGG